MNRALIIADDLTGAAELAAFVGTTAMPARVAWPPSVHESWCAPAAGAPSLVIDTESRNLAAGEARDRLARIVRDLPREWLRGFVYKKIDSTLRGPIQEEVTLLHDLARLGPVIAAPAYPRMGRTTRGGVQYLHGVAVADGPAGADPVGAARESNVSRLLPPGDAIVLSPPASRSAPELANEISRNRSAGRHIVIDAEREGDLERLAEALHSLPPGLIVGTGGLARHLWPPKRYAATEGAEGRIVVIVGSHHPAAREQAIDLQRVHACHRVDAERHENRCEHRDEVLVLTTPDQRVDPGAALRDLDDALKEVIALGVPRAVVVTGGESALHVLKRVGATSLDVLGELVDGVPIGLIVGGSWADTILATKAGGFGGPDILARAVGRLREGATASP